MSILGRLSGAVLLGCDEPDCRAAAYVGEGTADWTTVTRNGPRRDWCPEHSPGKRNRNAPKG